MTTKAFRTPYTYSYSGADCKAYAWFDWTNVRNIDDLFKVWKQENISEQIQKEKKTFTQQEIGNEPIPPEEITLNQIDNLPNLYKYFDYREICDLFINFLNKEIEIAETEARNRNLDFYYEKLGHLSSIEEYLKFFLPTADDEEILDIKNFFTKDLRSIDFLPDELPVEPIGHENLLEIFFEIVEQNKGLYLSGLDYWYNVVDFEDEVYNSFTSFYATKKVELIDVLTKYYDAKSTGEDTLKIKEEFVHLLDNIPHPGVEHWKNQTIAKSPVVVYKRDGLLNFDFNILVEELRKEVFFQKEKIGFVEKITFSGTYNNKNISFEINKKDYSELDDLFKFFSDALMNYAEVYEEEGGLPTYYFAKHKIPFITAMNILATFINYDELYLIDFTSQVYGVDPDTLVIQVPQGTRDLFRLFINKQELELDIDYKWIYPEENETQLIVLQKSLAGFNIEPDSEIKIVGGYYQPLTDLEKIFTTNLQNENGWSFEYNKYYDVEYAPIFIDKLNLLDDVFSKYSIKKDSYEEEMANYKEIMERNEYGAGYIVPKLYSEEDFYQLLDIRYTYNIFSILYDFPGFKEDSVFPRNFLKNMRDEVFRFGDEDEIIDENLFKDDLLYSSDKSYSYNKVWEVLSENYEYSKTFYSNFYEKISNLYSDILELDIDIDLLFLYKSIEEEPSNSIKIKSNSECLELINCMLSLVSSGYDYIDRYTALYFLVNKYKYTYTRQLPDAEKEEKELERISEEVSKDVKVYLEKKKYLLVYGSMDDKYYPELIKQQVFYNHKETWPRYCDIVANRISELDETLLFDSSAFREIATEFKEFYSELKTTSEEYIENYENNIRENLNTINSTDYNKYLIEKADFDYKIEEYNFKKDDITIYYEEKITLGEPRLEVDESLKQWVMGTTHLKSLVTLSLSIHDAKAPVRRLGHVAPVGFTKAIRTIAGTMVFLIIEDHPLRELMARDPSNYQAPWGADNLDRDSMVTRNFPLKIAENQFSGYYWSYDQDFIRTGRNELNKSYSYYDNNKIPAFLSSLISPFNLLLHYQTEVKSIESGKASMLIEGIEITGESIVTSVNDMVTEVVVQFVAKDVYQFSGSGATEQDIIDSFKMRLSSKESPIISTRKKE